MPKSKPKTEPLVPQDADEKEESVVIPCSLEEVEQHLRAFIAAFVLPHAQSRWLEFLIEKRHEWDIAHPTPRSIKMHTKAREVLRDFAIDERFCTRVQNAQRVASHYKTIVGTDPAVYFNPDTPPCKITAVEAETRFAWDDSSALLSFKAGGKVLFFHHDDGVYLCEKE